MEKGNLMEALKNISGAAIEIETDGLVIVNFTENPNILGDPVKGHSGEEVDIWRISQKNSDALFPANYGCEARLNRKNGLVVFTSSS